MATLLYGGFLKWWYPTTMGFPTKNDHFGVFWGTTIFGNTHILFILGMFGDECSSDCGTVQEKFGV